MSVENYLLLDRLIHVALTIYTRFVSFMDQEIAVIYFILLIFKL